MPYDPLIRCDHCREASLIITLVPSLDPVPPGTPIERIWRCLTCHCSWSIPGVFLGWGKHCDKRPGA